MCSGVYVTTGCPSVCLSVPPTAACGAFAAKCRAGGRYRLIAAGAQQQQRRRSAANASSVAFTAAVGG